MNQGSNNYAAPFGNLATGSTISNLTVANSNFTADKWVAGITCKNSGTITNCTVGAKFVLSNSVNQQYYGGIVGYNYGASPVSGCLCYSTDVTSNLNFFKILIGLFWRSCKGNNNILNSTKIIHLFHEHRLCCLLGLHWSDQHRDSRQCEVHQLWCLLWLHRFGIYLGGCRKYNIRQPRQL